MSLGLLACFALSAFAQPIYPSTTDSNVILIVIDDAGPELFGAYDTYFATTTGQPSGHPAATPAIDNMLAAQGVSFARAWSNPVCSPTRAALLTGRYSYRTGVGCVTTTRPTPVRPGLSYDHVLLPEPLRSAPVPFTSIAVGKWHLADRAQLNANPQHPLGAPAGRWFDAWAGSYFQVAVPDGFDPKIYGYSVWKKSFANYVNTLSAPCSPGAPPCQIQMVAPPIENYATVNTAEDAIACLQEATGPLFLYVAFNAVHFPVHDVPSGLPTATCPGYSRPATPCNYGALAEEPARVRCMLESLDGQIARLLCAVDFDTTTVILLSDNGTLKKASVAPYLASHAKGAVYEGGLRVPLIIRSPVTPANRRGTFVEAPVNTVDLFATVCELAGVATPASASDSVSLLPYLLGATAPERAFVYGESFFPNFTPDPLTGNAPAGYAAKHHEQAVCDGRFKLTRISRRSANSTPTVKEEFFDLLEGGPPAAGSSSPTPDYFEQNNLLLAVSMTPEASAALATLRSRLDTDFPYLTR